MAKLSGPYMSEKGSGTIGNLLTASSSRGQAYMRLRVTPKDPNTNNQQVQRALLSFMDNITKQINIQDPNPPFYFTAFVKYNGQPIPNGQSWISAFQKYTLPILKQLSVRYNALSPLQSTLYKTEANNDGMTDVSVGPFFNVNKGFSIYVVANFVLEFFKTGMEPNDIDVLNFIEIHQIAKMMQSYTHP